MLLSYLIIRDSFRAVPAGTWSTLGKFALMALVMMFTMPFDIGFYMGAQARALAAKDEPVYPKSRALSIVFACALLYVAWQVGIDGYLWMAGAVVVSGFLFGIFWRRLAAR